MCICVHLSVVGAGEGGVKRIEANIKGFSQMGGGGKGRGGEGRERGHLEQKCSGT